MRRPTISPGWAAGALIGVVGITGALGRLWRRCSRVVVLGDSMRPTLLPGDRLVVWRTRQVRLGDLVVLPDPRAPQRPLVKRVVHQHPDGALLLRGDNPAASTDSRAFGTVPTTAVQGRVVYRYHPRERAGRLTRPGQG